MIEQQPWKGKGMAIDLAELKKHPFIVFGQEHYNPLGIVRTLGENGIKPIVIVYGGGLPLASKSKFASKVYSVGNIDEGYKLLLSCCSDGTMPFLCTSDDTTESYLDVRYDELVDKAYFFNAGSAGRVTDFMDKKAILDAAQKHGLGVLKAVVTKRGVVPGGLEYPVITKAISPTMGGWKDDMFVCHDEGELRSAFRSIQSDDVLVQKYIVKKNELCLEGFAGPGGCDMMVTIASTYNYYLPMSYSHYMTVRNLSNPGLEFKLRELLADIEFSGVFEVEFLEDQDGGLWFGEVNFRNSTWSYASTCAGMPLVLMWADSVLRGNVDHSLMRSVPENFTAIVEPSDFGERVKKKKMSLGAWLHDFKASNCKYYFGRGDDLRPVFFKIGEVLGRNAHARR